MFVFGLLDGSEGGRSGAGRLETAGAAAGAATGAAAVEGGVVVMSEMKKGVGGRRPVPGDCEKRMMSRFRCVVMSAAPVKIEASVSRFARSFR